VTAPDLPTNASLLVLLCTYNERENIERLLPMLSEVLPEADLLIVDDGSPDGTSDYIREQMRRNEKLSLIERKGKLGLGTAVLTGFRHAVEHHYDYLLTLDADLSHPPRYIPDILALRDRADVVIGSRYVAGGGVVGWSFKRKWMSWCINI
jgi:dolichol-phosphate mannosyltransferase